MTLYDKIRKYTASTEVCPDGKLPKGILPQGVYPFHMPGHKRNTLFLSRSQGDGSPVINFEKSNEFPFDLDVTEIHGFDDLHNLQPGGCLSEISRLAAELYGSHESFVLVNGSTVGNLAAIGALTKRGDKILTDINCHRSVKNAAELFGLTPVFIAPDTDDKTGVPMSISPDSVKSALRSNRDISLIVITSPSYEGIVSDIASIADTVHDTGAMLHVDCAHGAHFGFSDAFPKNPVALGADTVVMSLHKTLPALTQSSLLHVCSDRVDTDAVKRMLGILQTSSPSYVLMASIDYCLRLLQSDGERLFREYVENLAYFKKRTDTTRLRRRRCPYKSLSILGKTTGIFDFDRGKIVISARGASMSGFDLMSILREKYMLELERATDEYVVAMTSICDTREGFSRLADALNLIDRHL